MFCRCANICRVFLFTFASAATTFDEHFVTILQLYVFGHYRTSVYRSTATDTILHSLLLCGVSASAVSQYLVIALARV
jgi:hypothetical protein